MRVSVVASSLLAFAFVGCADAPAAGDGELAPTGLDAPVEVTLTCGEDGSTSLSSDTVRAQPDGAHLVIVNRYDEPVSVEGFDADPGRTTWVLTNAPGSVGLMCWPFSQHGNGKEPDRTPLTIVDPDGLYVDGTMSCGELAGMAGSYGEPPVEELPSPEEAREAIAGLDPSDELVYAGYRQQEQRRLVVIREDEVVGEFEIARWEGRPWEVVSYSVCADSGLSNAAPPDG